MPQSLRDELTRWGFSDSEVDVYLAALETEQAPASEIATQAGVSTRHVYRISERLEEIGLVDVQEQYQPTRIRPAPAEEVAEIMQRRQEAIVTEIERRREGAQGHTGDLEVLKRKVTVLGRCRAILSEAAEWIIFVAPADLLESVADELRAAYERGVLVQLFTEDVTELGGRPLDEFASVVRVQENFQMFHQFAIGADYYRSLVVTPHAMDLPTDEQFAPALYVEGESITPRINASFLEYEWRLGEERLVPDRVELPATFDGFTAAVVQATLHRAAGTDVRATVEAREIDDDGTAGSAATVEGEVVEARQGIVEPYRKSFLFEQALVLDTDDGEVTVGGPGGTVEDYAAQRVELLPIDGMES